MRLTSLATITLLALLPLISHAGVIYEWRALNHEVPRGFAFSLEFDHGTVRSGAFSMQVGSEQPGLPKPTSGLLAIRYVVSGGGFTYFPRKDAFSDGFGYLDLDLEFDNAGFLTGYIYANDTFSHIEMRSHGKVFAVLDANSDAGMPGAGCGWQGDVPCAGAMGHIRQVPEPASISLLGVGLLGAYAARRKQGSA